MPNAWPATLPQYPLEDSVTESQEPIVQRSTMSTGLERVRRRYTSPVRKFTIGVGPLTLTQVETLDVFFTTTCKGGAETVEWYHPRKVQDSDFTQVELRFVGTPMYKPMGGGFWRADFSMEILP